MKIVHPGPYRHSLLGEEHELQITISAERSWFRIPFLIGLSGFLLFFTLFLGMFWVLLFAGAVGLIRTAPGPRATNASNWLPFAFITPILLDLLFLNRVAIRSLAWQIFGQEIIVATPDQLEIRRKVLWWQGSWLYQTAHFSDLRVAMPGFVGLWVIPRNFTQMIGVRGTIAFDYGAKTHEFGWGLQEGEAREIISKIKGFSQSFEVRKAT